jgi:hypothetical protein
LAGQKKKREVELKYPTTLTTAPIRELATNLGTAGGGEILFWKVDCNRWLIRAGKVALEIRLLQSREVRESVNPSDRRLSTAVDFPVRLRVQFLGKPSRGLPVVCT